MKKIGDEALPGTRGKVLPFIIPAPASRVRRTKALPRRSSVVHRLVTTSAALPVDPPEWDEV